MNVTIDTSSWKPLVEMFGVVFYQTPDFSNGTGQFENVIGIGVDNSIISATSFERLVLITRSNHGIVKVLSDDFRAALDDKN